MKPHKRDDGNRIIGAHELGSYDFCPVAWSYEHNPGKFRKWYFAQKIARGRYEHRLYREKMKAGATYVRRTPVWVILSAILFLLMMWLLMK